MCKSDESKEIAKTVMKSSKKTREEDVATILSRDWQSFECCIDLIITIQRPKKGEEASENTQATIRRRTRHLRSQLDFIHFLILTRKYRFLLQFLNSFQKEFKFNVVRVDIDVHKPSRQDSWIFGANYVHLAVKYCPEALEILLQDSRFDKLAQEPNAKRNVYPLHLAVMNENNLSAK